MNVQKPDLYALIVGDRAHRIAAALAGQNLEQDRSIRAIALTDTAQAIFAKYPVEYRPRESIFQAVTAAGFIDVFSQINFLQSLDSIWTTENLLPVLK